MRENTVKTRLWKDFRIPGLLVLPLVLGASFVLVQSEEKHPSRRSPEVERPRIERPRTQRPQETGESRRIARPEISRSGQNAHFHPTPAFSAPGPGRVQGFTRDASPGSRTKEIRRPDHFTRENTSTRIHDLNRGEPQKFWGSGRPITMNRLPNRPGHRPEGEHFPEAGNRPDTNRPLWSNHPGNNHFVDWDRIHRYQRRFPGYRSFWTNDWYHQRPWAWRPNVNIPSRYWFRPVVWVDLWRWGNGSLWTQSDYPVQPVYYNYGDNIAYDDDKQMVYVNGIPYLNAEEYYEQGVALADEGIDLGSDQEEIVQNPGEEKSNVSNGNDPHNQWMPLGSFAVLSEPDQEASQIVLQLAMNKNGVIRGNIYNQETDKVHPIEGAVDRETQRVAFRITGDKDYLAECGLWNLTQDTLPLLVHKGKSSVGTRTLIRLNDPDQQSEPSPQSAFAEPLIRVRL